MKTTKIYLITGCYGDSHKFYKVKTNSIVNILSGRSKQTKNKLIFKYL